MTYIPDPGSLSTSRLLSAAASTNATSVKASPGRLARIDGRVNRVTALFLKLYDKASAPTVGTDMPKATIELPPASYFDFAINSFFATGIAYALTTAAADADTGALAAGDVTTMNLYYT